MKIKFEDITEKNDWLHRCLLSSLTNEVIESGKENRSFEVKLLVNGIELEPNLLQDILSGVEKYIDQEALSLFENKFSEEVELIRQKTNQLTDMIDEAQDKIRKEFNITQED